MTDLDSIAGRLAPVAGIFLALAAVAVEIFVALPLLYQTATPTAPLRSPLGCLVLSAAVFGSSLLSVRLVSGPRRSTGELFSWFFISVWGLIFLGVAFRPPAAMPPRQAPFFGGFSLLLSALCFSLAYDRFRKGRRERPEGSSN